MGKIERFTLEQFTAFNGPLDFEFCPGINVLIGANSTGKTHLMKAMYACLKVCERAHQDQINQPERLAFVAEDYFKGVFKPEQIGSLARHHTGNNTARVSLTFAGRTVSVVINSRNTLSVEFDQIPDPDKFVYLPVHEFLSIFPGFIGAYQERETAFDQTYYDLAVSLSALPLRGPKAEEIRGLLEPLQKAIAGAKVTQENQHFYIRLPEGKLEAPLVSEGYRKIAGLLYLINNGSLTRNSILFWDEPEANLNPKMMVNIVEALKILAGSGMQIFLSTHDYLLSQELSLLAETSPETEMQFYALYQNKKTGVQFERARSLAEIENNPILEEFAAHYDREIKWMADQD